MRKLKLVLEFESKGYIVIGFDSLDASPEEQLIEWVSGLKFD